MRSGDMFTHGFGAVFVQQILIYWYLIPIFAIVIILKSTWFKGVYGEFKVNFFIKLFLPASSYHLIKDVTIPSGKGSTQIDHILVSRYGVFVIETKNMAGRIFGGEYDNLWMQVLYKHKHNFQNPIKQNDGHVRALKKLIDIKNDRLFSIVVFVGRSRLKSDTPQNVKSIFSFIKYIRTKNNIILNDFEVDEIISLIEAQRFPRGFKTNYKHIRYVKSLIKNRK
jgi:restriction system protein